MIHMKKACIILAVVVALESALAVRLMTDGRELKEHVSRAGDSVQAWWENSLPGRSMRKAKAHRFRKRYDNFPEPMRCPVCGGEALPLEYGLLRESFFEDSLAFDLSGRRRVIAAGCCIGDADWGCTECQERFRESL